MKLIITYADGFKSTHKVRNNSVSRRDTQGYFMCEVNERRDNTKLYPTRLVESVVISDGIKQIKIYRYGKSV